MFGTLRRIASRVAAGLGFHSAPNAQPAPAPGRYQGPPIPLRRFAPRSSEDIRRNPRGVTPAWLVQEVLEGMWTRIDAEPPIRHEHKPARRKRATAWVNHQARYRALAREARKAAR